MPDGSIQPEFSIRRSPDSLEISMPAEGPETGRGFVIFMRVIWGCLEFAALFALWQQLAGRAPGMGNFPAALPVIVWTVFGAFMLNSIELTRGREVVSCGPTC